MRWPCPMNHPAVQPWPTRILFLPLSTVTPVSTMFSGVVTTLRMVVPPWFDPSVLHAAFRAIAGRGTCVLPPELLIVAKWQNAPLVVCTVPEIVVGKLSPKLSLAEVCWGEVPRPLLPSIEALMET